MYNPHLHIIVNKPISPDQGIPDDGRSYFYDEALFLYRPYQSTAEAIAYLPLSIPRWRKGHFTLVINIGGALQPDGSFVGGINTEYWWRDNQTDAGLIEKYPSPTSNKETFTRSADFSKVFASSKLIDKILFEPANDINLQIGTTLAGDEILFSTPISAADPQPVTLFKKVNGATTWYFTGISFITNITIWYAN